MQTTNPSPAGAIRNGERVGKYRVEKLLARGGFARVFRGFDTHLRRRVAIKVPSIGYGKRRAVLDFSREASAVQSLPRHQNILPVLDFVVHGNTPVIVAPLGRSSLADRLERPLQRALVLRYAYDLLLALAHIHRRELLHLDVKPENLIVLHSGRLALADFGAARRGRWTVADHMIGTSGYMDAAHAGGRPSARSDVYSAAVVIREMLWGRTGCEHGPQKRFLPRGFAKMLARAQEPEPRRRHADAGEMLNELRRVRRNMLHDGCPEAVVR